MTTKKRAPAAEAAGEQIAIEVTAVHKEPGITFRPGIVYQASAKIRDRLEKAGVLKKD